MNMTTVALGENRRKAATLVGSFSGPILARAARDAFLKLNPRKLLGNPVIFATEIVAVLATISTVLAIMDGGDWGFALQIALWLWATVIFANLAESVAEGRGKAAADSLRATRVTTKAKLIVDPKTGTILPTPAHKLGVGEIVLVEAGDVVP